MFPNTELGYADVHTVTPFLDGWTDGNAVSSNGPCGKSDIASARVYFISALSPYRHMNGRSMERTCPQGNIFSCAYLASSILVGRSGPVPLRDTCLLRWTGEINDLASF